MIKPSEVKTAQVEVDCQEVTILLNLRNNDESLYYQFAETYSTNRSADSDYEDEITNFLDFVESTEKSIPCTFDIVDDEMDVVDSVNYNFDDVEELIEFAECEADEVDGSLFYHMFNDYTNHNEICAEEYLNKLVEEAGGIDQLDEELSERVENFINGKVVEICSERNRYE